MRDGGDITQIPAFDFSQKPIGNCKPLGFCCVQLNGSKCLCFGQPHGVWQYSELGAECCEAECRRLFVWPIPIIASGGGRENRLPRGQWCVLFLLGRCPSSPPCHPFLWPPPTTAHPALIKFLFCLTEWGNLQTNKHKTVRH